MSRSGVEEKPAWRQIPHEVRAAVARALGSDVRRAARVWGSYAPTPTFRLTMQDGRRAFFKGVGPADNEFATAALVREARNYQELGELIEPWAPALLAEIWLPQWHALLLEDVGPKSVPPWTLRIARGVSQDIARFHLHTPGKLLPEWLPQPFRPIDEARSWLWLRDPERLDAVAGMAREREAQARRWLRQMTPLLIEMSAKMSRLPPPYALVHGDIRSDNLRWRNGRLRLFDWPHATVGAPEDDLAEFAQTVTVEGGPAPEVIVEWYAKVAPVRDEVLDVCLVAMAGFFADAAWRADIPGLPRLRAFQRAQMVVTVRWLARRLDLPEPGWLEAVGSTDGDPAGVN